MDITTHTATAGEPRPTVAGLAPSPRPISLGDLRAALREGTADFMALPSHNFLLALLYPLAGLVLIQAASGSGLMPLLFPLASGFALIGPAAAVGLFEISRLREQGQTPGWRDALGPFRRAERAPLLRLMALLLALLVGWLLSAFLVYRLTLGAAPPPDLWSLLTAALTTPRGWVMIAVGNGLGLVFALAALLLGTFSLANIVDGETRAREAIAFSIAAFGQSRLPMLAWGAFVGAVTFAAVVLGLVGLAITLPICAHATWRLYRRAAGGPHAPR